MGGAHTQCRQRRCVRGPRRAADEACRPTARQSQVTKPKMRAMTGSHSSSAWLEGQPAERLVSIFSIISEDFFFIIIISRRLDVLVFMCEPTQMDKMRFFFSGKLSDDVFYSSMSLIYLSLISQTDCVAWLWCRPPCGAY